MNAEKHYNSENNDFENPKEYIEKIKKRVPQKIIDNLYKEMAKNE